MTRSGSLAGRLLVLAALGYLAYSYAIFGFSVVINVMTPVHIAILGFATWALVLTIFGLHTAVVDGAASVTLPRRVAGGFLIIVAALFALLWLGQIGGAVISGHLPHRSLRSTCRRARSMPSTSHLPFRSSPSLAGGWWLVRGEPHGPASAFAALCWLVLMGLSVLAIFAVDAAAGVAGAADALVPAALFAIITGVAALLALVGYRSL